VLEHSFLTDLSCISKVAINLKGRLTLLHLLRDLLLLKGLHLVEEEVWVEEAVMVWDHHQNLP
jgi:hypothetical protein